MQATEAAEVREIAPHIPAGLELGLRNYWYPILQSEELGREKPLAIQRLGEHLVVWRDGDGAPRTLRDRCPHRAAKLSIGRILDGQLQCIFHGLRFDGMGQCALIPWEPDDSPLRSGVCVTAYPTRELAGYIWCYLGDTAQFPRPAAGRRDSGRADQARRIPLVPAAEHGLARELAARGRRQRPPPRRHPACRDPGRGQRGVARRRREAADRPARRAPHQAGPGLLRDARDLDRPRGRPHPPGPRAGVQGPADGAAVDQHDAAGAGAGRGAVRVAPVAVPGGRAEHVRRPLRGGVGRTRERERWTTLFNDVVEPRLAAIAVEDAMVAEAQGDLSAPGRRSTCSRRTRI